MGRYFEGWYFKHQKEQETLSIIVGRADDGAFLQVITQDDSYRVRYPVSLYHKAKILRLADSWFGEDHLHLSVHREELELMGDLHYHDLTLLDGNIMGPFRFLPMQCRHEIISMNHTLDGSVYLNGKELIFTGGKGYIEGDAGYSFPKSYTWVQCNSFTEDCSIMAAVAHIPFMLTWFWGCICVIWLNGVEYRLATYRGATIKHRDERQLVLVQKDLTLEIQFLQSHSGHILDAPSRGKMERSVWEVPCAPANFELRKGSEILFQGESRFASYEQIL